MYVIFSLSFSFILPSIKRSEYTSLRKFGFLRRKSTSCHSCRIYSSARNRPELARSNPTGLPSAKRYIVESYPCPTGASSTPDRWEYIIIRARDEALFCALCAQPSCITPKFYANVQSNQLTSAAF